MELKDRINKRIKELKLTQDDVAARSGISQGMVYKLTSGKAKTTAKLVGLAKALECSIEWLGTGEGEMIDANKHSNVTATAQLQNDVPVISWIQAGNWNEAIDTYHPGDSEEKLPRPAKGGRMVYGLVVRGDSMTAPPGVIRTFLEGERIYVDPEQRNPENGDFVIAKVNGHDEVTFKQYKVEDGKQYLNPLNPKWDPIFAEFRVLGRVIGKYQTY